MIYFVVAIIVILIDQLSKQWVANNMTIGESIPIIEEVFYLTSHRNAGAAFGILQNQRWFFLIITTLVVIAVIYYLNKIRKEKALMAWSLALILGGAIGNFIDRLFLGEVIDFFDVKIRIGSFYHDFAIFNVADSALVIGVGLFLLDAIKESIHEAKAKKTMS